MAVFSSSASVRLSGGSCASLPANSEKEGPVLSLSAKRVVGRRDARGAEVSVVEGLTVVSGRAVAKERVWWEERGRVVRESRRGEAR